MLYTLTATDGKFDKLEPHPFKDFAAFANREKDLEDLIASNILELLFEDASLMPVFQERPRQGEADIYALNEKGELFIFELKRGPAGEGAVHQALRYAETAGQWSYAKLKEMYQKYIQKYDKAAPGKEVELTKAHQEAFNLEHELDAKEINRCQHLIVIGSAADDQLIGAVDYWKRQGVTIDFLPYRIYQIADEQYFEFFALPYDRHSNPGYVKGILFDTCKKYEPDAIWYMIDNKRVAAFGDAKRFINHVYPGDIVFFSHSGKGIVAAATVRKGDIEADGKALYRDVDFSTPIPVKGSQLKAMPFKMVSEVTGKSFYWAKTIKVPYLSRNEALKLADELRKYLQGGEEA